MPQEPNADGLDQWGMSGAEWQKHRSGWFPNDFPLENGWTVIASKVFHVEHAYRRELKTPFGAMWCIWNAK